jgi:hypothetical protein
VRQVAAVNVAVRSDGHIRNCPSVYEGWTYGGPRARRHTEITTSSS